MSPGAMDALFRRKSFATARQALEFLGPETFLHKVHKHSVVRGTLVLQSLANLYASLIGPC